MRLSQNSKGQISKQLSILITKELQDIAKDCESRVKIAVRNELENQHIHDVYSTFAPTQISGKKTAEYNKKHKHQKKQPYEHTGTLLSSIHGVIDGDVVKIEIDEAEKYSDGTTAKQVYDWLDKGTSESEYDVYILGGKNTGTPYVGYEPQPKHDFKKLTLNHMDNFIENTLIPDIKAGKYTRKTKKGAK